MLATTSNTTATVFTEHPHRLTKAPYPPYTSTLSTLVKHPYRIGEAASPPYVSTASTLNSTSAMFYSAPTLLKKNEIGDKLILGIDGKLLIQKFSCT